MSQEIKWTILNPPERSRKYVFPNGDELEIKNVAKIEVRDSGKHRIETTDGKKYFVNTGWFWMEIETDDWTC